MENSELSRMLSADEAAELAPLPESDVETPTMSLPESVSQSTAAVHYPGIMPSTESDAESDAVPDPAPVTEEK